MHVCLLIFSPGKALKCEVSSGKWDTPGILNQHMCGLIVHFMNTHLSSQPSKTLYNSLKGYFEDTCWYQTSKLFPDTVLQLWLDCIAVLIRYTHNKIKVWGHRDLWLLQAVMCVHICIIPRALNWHICQSVWCDMCVSLDVNVDVSVWDWVHRLDQPTYITSTTTTDMDTDWLTSI